MAESEADTPSTPIEFESKYFEFDGVRLPPFCRGKMEEIAGFSLRSSDIWIVTYPKSGKQPARHRVRSWVQTDALRNAYAQHVHCSLQRFDAGSALKAPSSGFRLLRNTYACTAEARRRSLHQLTGTSSDRFLKILIRPRPQREHVIGFSSTRASEPVCCRTCRSPCRCLHPPGVVAQRCRAQGGSAHVITRARSGPGEEPDHNLDFTLSGNNSHSLFFLFISLFFTDFVLMRRNSFKLIKCYFRRVKSLECHLM